MYICVWEEHVGNSAWIEIELVLIDLCTDDMFCKYVHMQLRDMVDVARVAQKSDFSFLSLTLRPKKNLTSSLLGEQRVIPSTL